MDFLDCEVTVFERRCWTRFHVGRQPAVVTRGMAAGLRSQSLATFRHIEIGGRVQPIVGMCFVPVMIGEHSFEVSTYIVDDLGSDETGRPFGLRIGTVTMRQLGIKLDGERGCLDLTHVGEVWTEFLTAA